MAMRTLTGCKAEDVRLFAWWTRATLLFSAWWTLLGKCIYYLNYNQTQGKTTWIKNKLHLSLLWWGRGILSWCTLDMLAYCEHLPGSKLSPNILLAGIFKFIDGNCFLNCWEQQRTLCCRLRSQVSNFSKCQCGQRVTNNSTLLCRYYGVKSKITLFHHSQCCRVYRTLHNAWRQTIPVVQH